MTEWPGIDEVLRRADSSFNAGTISEAILKLLQANPGLTLDKIEERFRAIGAKTHLTARPAKIAPTDLCVFDIVKNKPAKFWLWICLHGEDEARDILAEDGTEVAGNSANLKETGFLVIGETPSLRN